MKPSAILQIFSAGFLLVLAGCGSGSWTDEGAAQTSNNIHDVTALGRVTPGRAVMAISAQPGTRLRSLEVREGQHVSKGDPLAYLDAYPLRLAQRDAAAAALDEAREKLATSVQLGEATIEQNRRSVALAEVARAHGQSEVARISPLVARQVVPRQRLIDQQYDLDSRTVELARARAELNVSRAALAQTRSAAGIRSAEAAVRTAEAELELTIIRAPIDGEILKIFTYAGERIGDSPILNMGDGGDMHVVAAVYETDIGRVRVGQSATVSSPALPAPVIGRVEEVGQLIYKNDVLALDPRAPRDTRVVEVRIRLAPSPALARLSNLEVTTRINVGSGR
jgi:HlyD family secretion protein